MARKANFDDFNLNTNEFESDERFTVTISSDSDFDDDENPFTLTNYKNSKNLLKCASISSLERISSADEDIHESAIYKWHSISIKTDIDVVRLKNEYPDFNSKYSILNTILENVEPFQFVPYLFSEVEGFYSFYVFHSEDAINKLHSQDYICKSKIMPNFNIKLQVNETKTRNLNASYLIKTSLKKRYNKTNKSLNLSDFVNDNNLKKVFYIPLWYVGNQTLIVSKIKEFINTKNINELDLSSNSISDFEGFNIAVTFSNLKSLNVSKNNISHIKGLVPFRGLMINVFNLQFNPICHNYICKKEYIKSIKLIFPTVKILDLNNITNLLPYACRNYTVDSDSIPLVDRFMAIYFSLFDSEDRSAMINLYSKNAIFSISCDKKDSTFHKKARNLINTNSSNFYIGPRSIIGCLCWIPPTEHIPLTFCVDVVHSSEQYLIINISGIFALTSNYHNIRCYNFMRTFNIICEEEEYKISNDMMNINAIQLSELPSDLYPDLKKKLEFDFTPPENLADNMKIQLLEAFMALTKFSHPMAENCLVKSNWNFLDATKMALNILKSV